MSKNNFRFRLAAVTLLTVLFITDRSVNCAAQETGAEEPAKLKSSAGDSQAENDKSFQELLNNCVLVGQFTIDGQTEGPAKQERYEIRNVSKLDNDELWGMTTRISYGDHDVTVPIAVPVKFAGKTPMISLDDFFVPGLGTFSARVMFHGNRYAGTWQHGDKGGHMFGYIERLKDAPATENPDKK